MSFNNETGSHNSLLLFKKGDTPEFILKAIREQNLRGLKIFSHLKEDRLPDLDFLKGCSFLEELDISSTQDYDFSFLMLLTKLKTLSISIEGNNVIDLSYQKNLENLVIQWRKEKIVGLEHCKKLSTVGLYASQTRYFVI